MSVILHGFELQRESVINELRSQAKLFRHVKTGARLLSITNDDENKVFGISFKTPPKDSTGVAHILEHTVLRGSRNYPVKEPFVELMKGSLNTFLNAFTFPDKTCYPVASQHLQDFYNLIDVYLDSVLHPLLKKDAFETEGWHYELTKEEDPLIYKGIVFNEMKGVCSDPRRIVNYRSMETLLPDTLYALSSGGDPEHIPDLTYEQFVAFHKAYYHPSNSYSYFWGNDSEEQRLRLMNEWFSPFDYLEPQSSISFQQRFAHSKSFSFPCPSGDSPEEVKKSRVVVNWMLDATEQYPALDLSFLLLSHMMVGTPASPLRKALLDSGFGEDLENGIDIEDDLIQKCFSVGLLGVAAENTEKVEPLVLSILERLVANGIDEETKKASINTIEFALRERKDFLSTSYLLPPGLFLMIRALGPWIHGGDPIDRLAFAKPLEEIKLSHLQNPHYFEDLIQKYFLNNSHRVTVTLTPDSEFSLKKQKQESERLSGCKDRKSPKEITDIIVHTKFLQNLREISDRPQDLATIPRIIVSELAKENRQIPIEVLKNSTNVICFHDIPTNGIVYIDVGFNLQYLSQDLIPLVPLFSQALLGMNTEQKTYMQLAQAIGATTGGVTFDTFVKTHHISHVPVAMMFIRGKGMAVSGNKFIDLLSEICLKTRFDDKERFRQLVLLRKSELESLLSSRGHHMVYRRLRAMNTETDRIDEIMNGFEQLLFVRRLVSDIDEHWDDVRNSLERIRVELLCRPGMVLNVTTDHVSFQGLKESLMVFQNKFPAGLIEIKPRKLLPLMGPEGFSMPSQVNYVGAAYDLSSVGYREHGSSLVAQMFLRTTWLWDRVRVQGGAYGGMVALNLVTGLLCFFSYRDPNVLKTLEIYRQTSGFLENLSLSKDELDKSIVAAIGNIDGYLLPDEKGYQSLQCYLIGDSEERRQRMREEVLSTGVSEFKTIGSLLHKALDQEKVVVLGSREAILGAQMGGSIQFHITPIL